MHYALSVAQNLRVAVVEHVNDGDDLRVLLELSLLRRGDKRPELVDVDDRAPLEVARKVEAAHTNLSEVTRMVLIEVRPIRVQLPTRVTPRADAGVTGRESIESRVGFRD